MTESAATIVLIPGLGNTAALWETQVEALSPYGQVIVPDYRGSTSIREMADRVLEQAPRNELSVVGFSLGGYIALDIVSRFAGRLKKLAFISSSPYADDETAVKQRNRLIEIAKTDYGKLLEDMGGFIVAPDGPYAENARQTLIAMGEDLGANEFCRQQRATMARSDYTALLESIDLPVRVLCGVDDVVTPVAGNRYLADHIPGASLRIVERVGHLLPLESPDAVSAFLIDWARSRP